MKCVTARYKLLYAHAAVEKLTVDELLDGAFLDDNTPKSGKSGPKAAAQPTPSVGACSYQLLLGCTPDCLEGHLRMTYQVPSRFAVQVRHELGSQKRKGGTRMKVLRFR